MNVKLNSDSDLGNKAKKIFEIIKTDTNVFEGYSQADIDQMMSVLKLLKFNAGDQIC